MAYKCIIPLQEKKGNYDSQTTDSHSDFNYTTTREKGELRLSVQL